MSILTHNNKIGKISNGITSKQTADLVFQVQGQAFLQWLYNPNDPYAATSLPNPNGYLAFASSTANSAIIDYGDGVVETHQFYHYGGFFFLAFSSQIGYAPNTAIANYNPIDNHIFQDGNTDLRDVHIIISNANSIFEIISSVVFFYNELPPNMFTLNNLSYLALSYTEKLTSFPYEFVLLKKITTLNLNTIASTLLIQFPTQFLSFPMLSVLSISGVFDFSDLEASNAKDIAVYGSKLTSLVASACKMSDIPIEWAKLTNLTSLNIDSNNFTKPPDNINFMSTTIQVFSFAGGHSTNTTITDWNDFSNLINMTNLYYYAAPNFSTDFPSWISAFTKLRQLNFMDSYLTDTRLTAHITSVYNFIIANASMTGLASLPFRGMSINTYYAPSNKTPRPSGTYQQPTGYVQGSNNGTPASAMEMIWVLVNQYAHVWTLNPNT